MLKVSLTRKAEDSLSDIIDYYLTNYSAERATKVVESVDEAFEEIGAYPLNYPVCFDIKLPVENIRQIIVHHTFKIVYRINKDSIEVLEIFHGKRDPDLLKEIDG
jgi:plasmid stabilization system protein ParE